MKTKTILKAIEHDTSKILQFRFDWAQLSNTHSSENFNYETDKSSKNNSCLTYTIRISNRNGKWKRQTWLGSYTCTWAQDHKTKAGDQTQISGRHFSQSDAWDLSLVSKLSFLILGPGCHKFNFVITNRTPSHHIFCHLVYNLSWGGLHASSFNNVNIKYQNIKEENTFVSRENCL
jgi:hypothetical protein